MTHLPDGPTENYVAQERLLLFVMRTLTYAGAGLFLYSLGSVALPDYTSYEQLYERAETVRGDFLALGKMMAGLKYVGISYEGFRTAVFLTGLYFLLLCQRSFAPQYRWNYPSLSLNRLLLLMLCAVFIFEYSMIRLRAGLSVIWFLAVYLWILAKGYHRNDRPSWRKVAFLVVLQLPSLALHYETFVVLTLFTWPQTVSSIASRRLVSLNYYFVASGVLWVIFFFYGVEGSTNDRGEHLASDLHVVRLFALSILPPMMWMLLRLRRRKINSYATVRTRWVKMFDLNYLSCALTLLIFVLLHPNLTEGEAIVRVMSLSSAGAILSVVWLGLTSRTLISIYMLGCNSAFLFWAVYAS